MHDSRSVPTACAILPGKNATPRVAKVWKRKQDGHYYCAHDGKKVRPAEDRKDALTAFYALKGEAPKDTSEFRPSLKARRPLPHLHSVDQERADQ